MAYGIIKSPLLVRATPSYFKTVSGTPAGLNIVTDITLEAWINLTTLPSGNTYGVIAHPNNSGSSAGAYNFRIFESGGTQSIHFVRSNAGTQIISANWSPSTGIWYHIAVTHNTSTGAAVIYVDGSSIGTATNATVGDGDSSPTFVGMNGPGLEHPMNGRTSLVRIWSVVRTQAEIAANMCVVFGQAMTNMEAEWTLDDVLTDNSTNSNSLTNVNSVVFASNVPSVCFPFVPQMNII